MNIVIAGRNMPAFLNAASLRQLHIYAVEMEDGSYNVLKNVLTGQTGRFEKTEFAGILMEAFGFSFA